MKKEANGRMLVFVHGKNCINKSEKEDLAEMRESYITQLTNAVKNALDPEKKPKGWGPLAPRALLLSFLYRSVSTAKF